MQMLTADTVGDLYITSMERTPPAHRVSTTARRPNTVRACMFIRRTLAKRARWSDSHPVGQPATPPFRDARSDENGVGGTRAVVPDRSHLDRWTCWSSRSTSRCFPQPCASRSCLT